MRKRSKQTAAGKRAAEKITLAKINDVVLVIQQFETGKVTEALGWSAYDGKLALVRQRVNAPRVTPVEGNSITLRAALQWWYKMARQAERLAWDETFDDDARAAFLRYLTQALPVDDEPPVWKWNATARKARR